LSIDIIYIIILAMAALKGFRQGMVVAAFSFVAFFVGLAAAVKLSAIVAVWLEESFDKLAGGLSLPSSLYSQW
jgi:membrane protein required for colicin V production